MRILVVEDSERLRRSLGQGLSKLGHAVDLAADGQEGLHYALSYEYDVIVLDLMMPVLNGLDMLRQLRNQGRDAHVLILSAKDQVQDRVHGLELGADDYLVKPFSFDELCARLQALVRRKYQTKNPRIQIGPLELDTAKRQAFLGGKPKALTPNEYSVLEHLVLRRGRVVSQRQLLEKLYRSDDEVASNVIEVLVCGIRKKIQSPNAPPLLQTRRGLGYLIE